MDNHRRVGANLRVPPEEVLGVVRERYDCGQTLEALRQAEAFAPLHQWSGVPGGVLAARIAANLGAPGLALRLAVRTRRAAPRDAMALVHFGYELLQRRGPLATWRALRNGVDDTGASDEVRAECLTLRSLAAGGLREFATAEALLAQAESLAPLRPWIRLQRATLSEWQDRVEEALDLAAAACALHPHPFYRPGVVAQAHLLQLLDRDAEAIQLLSEANAVLQNAPLAGLWYTLLRENGRWPEAEAALERFVALSPLQEPPLRRWVDAERVQIAYHLGRREEAGRRAAALKHPFHVQLAARLATAPGCPDRVQLDVTFVRQHFKTCAPATLAALGRFWRLPAEHLQMVEAMCYDGTPSWRQRQWAEEHGWCVREFRVTYESAATLLERGVPFAVAVVDANSAHMVAVIGLDRLQGLLLLRDPGQPYVVEAPVEDFLTRYRAFGPHGMVFLPLAERARVEGLALPESALYDARYRFALALARHDRRAGAALVGEMEAAFPEHPLVWDTRHELAIYDGNRMAQAHCLDRLLELFPGSTARRLQRLACLRDAPRDEQVRWLESACAQPNADPALRVELARALAGDARELPHARQQLCRATKTRPPDGNALSVEAELCWVEGRTAEATELHRFAATLEGFREPLYQAWFVACRQTRRTDEAIAHLQDRFARFGGRSEQPALTLAWAWCQLDQPQRARQVLEEGVRRRAADADLKLRSVSLYASLGEPAQAGQILESVRGTVRENDWWRAAAELAELQGDSAASLRSARELLRLEPLAMDAHGGVTRALARLEGMAAAQAHLQAACEQFPCHYPLQRMRVECSRNLDPAALEKIVRELLQTAPTDAWARRELALVLVRGGRAAEALEVAEEAARVESLNTFSFSVLGYVHRCAGQLTEARAQLRRAVELSVDNRDAVTTLLDLARTDAERREELAFVGQQLVRQVVSGDGLLAYLELARPLLEPEPLLEFLREAQRERPDLWHAWSALVSQFTHLGRLDEALDLAREAVRRFPHLPQGWLDLAAVHRARNEPDEEIAAAERAVEVHPAGSRPAIALADAWERRGDLQHARAVYGRVLQRLPHDASLHGSLAHVLWRQQDPDGAFAALERALRLAPGYDWAWAMLHGWAVERGEPGRAADLARSLAREQPGELQVWLAVARVLHEPAEFPERIQAVDRALALDPRSVVAWDLKAELLASAERFEEARQTCEAGTAACSEGKHVLQGRHAWIEACQGQGAEAVRRMRDLLAENQHYAWGWDQLARWLSAQGKPAEAAEALEQLARLAPHDARVRQHLASLRLAMGDAASARDALVAALRLDPTEVGAAQQLLDLQLRTNDLEGAAATLSLMQLHQPGAATLAAEVRVELHRYRGLVPCRPFEALCASPDPDPWPLNAATEALVHAGRSAEALGLLAKALRSNACNPQVAAANIRLLQSRRATLRALRCYLRLPPGESRRRAAVPLVRGLPGRWRCWPLRWLLWRRSAELAGDTAAWGAVGQALIQCQRHRDAVRWLADWQTRPDVEPWMLFNLCLSLRHLGQCQEANAVAREVVTTWSHREGAADLHLFLAVEAGLAGAPAEAQGHLDRVVVREKVAYDRALLGLARCLVEFELAPPPERPRVFRTIRTRLADQFSSWAMLELGRDVRRTFRRAGKVFARQGGGWAARWWFGWRLHWHWLLVPVVLGSAAVLYKVKSLYLLVPILVVLSRFAARRDD